MRIQMVLCYFCYTNGINKKAKHTYTADDAAMYDVCDIHKGDAELTGFDTWEINENIIEDET